MKMEKKTFRIGELAHHLELEQFVIRFWEKEFSFKSHRSQGGQRYYTEQDLERFKVIKDLLYEQGLTIAGAKKYLHEQEHIFLASSPTTIKVNETPIETKAEQQASEAAPQSNEVFIAKLKELREKLQKMHDTL